MPETFNPVTLTNNAGQPLNAAYFNRLETGVELLDDRTAALELGIYAPIDVPFATSITLNATQGALFRCAAVGDVTLDGIVGGVDGQAVTLEVVSQGGTRVLDFTDNISSVSIPAGSHWTGTFRYHASSSSWKLHTTAGGAGVGTLTTASITDFTEGAQDAIAPLLTSGVHSGISFTYDDSNGRLNGSVAGHNAQRTVYSDEPRAGLTAITADGSTDDSSTLQAHLNYVKSTWGAGRVVLPANKSIKLNTGITIPAKVQLVADPSTTLDFSAISTATGVAIAINDSDFTPLIGGLIVGPSGDPRNTPSNTSDVSVGVAIVGVRLNIVDVQIKSFGRGIKGSHDNTWSISYIGGGIYQCYYNIWWDNDADLAVNAGESITFERTTIYNAVKGMRITGNGVSAFFDKCRIDYLLTRFGEFEDARVHFTNCHIEVGNTQIAYLFDVDRNAHVDFTACYILMGAGSPNITHYLFNPAKAPWNPGFGGARFSNTKIFYVDPSSANSEQRSDYMLEFPASQTTLNFHTPFPIRWCPVSAEFVASDFRTQDNHDTVRVSWSDAATGNVTLTASASSGGARFVRVRFS